MTEVRKVTKEQLRVHDKFGDPKGVDDLWVLVDGKVYDLSTFYKQHPGGYDIIEEYAGKDASKVFKDAGHPASAKKEMESYLVGNYVQPRRFTKIEEIADHNQPGDLWLLINNKVYDVSTFKHPGKSSAHSHFRWH
jgi:cytochrome b involved in lipid metabolism